MKLSRGRPDILTSFGRIVLASILALEMAPVVRGQVALDEELINRRRQARQAFLATPQSLYRHYCAHCHGEDAMGGGRLWAMDLPASPPDLTVLKADKNYVMAVIRGGSAAQGKSNLCPAWERTISPVNQERLAQYVVSLSQQPSLPPTAPATPGPVREVFPWFLLAVLLGELLLLGKLLFRRKGVPNVVP